MSNDQKIVLMAGGFGGIASWAYTLLAGTGTFKVSLALALPLCLVLGIAAAFVAVYLLTPTDTSQTKRLLAYALMCGFLWKPVLDGATALINQRLTVANTKVELPQQTSALIRGNPAEIPQKRTETETGATKLLRSSDLLGNPDVKQDATKPITDAVSAIAATSTQNPAAAHQSLEHIALVAKETNNPQVLQFTQEKLRLMARQ